MFALRDDFTTTTVDDGAGTFILTPENTGADPAGNTAWQTKVGFPPTPLLDGMPIVSPKTV